MSQIKPKHAGFCNHNSPHKFSIRDWWQVFKCVGREVGDDNVGVIAAGVAFFSMLAVFPLITACLSIYGLIADPVEVEQQLQAISGVMPEQAWAIIDTQLTAVVNAPLRGLGWGIVLGFAIALWSAGSGIRSMMRAMNVAYGEVEKRNFFKFYSLAISLTVSVTFFVWAALAVIVGVPAVLNFVRLEGAAQWMSIYMPWIILVLIFAFSTTVLYRIGPSRRQAKFRWVLPGVVLSTVLWVIVSFGFSQFVSEFGSYNKTYGGLSAAIILLIWFWLTAYVVILGAELNAELERHTLADTTRGPARPLGARGAAMADFKPANVEDVPEFIELPEASPATSPALSLEGPKPEDLV